MKVLNLVYPDKSDIPFSVVTFSDSQVYFKLEDPDALSGIDVDIESRMSWNDVQVIIAAHAALREAYVDNIFLTIPYFLGARSDRKFVIGGNNYIKDVIAPIINSLEFSNVTVMDPHSDIVEACINNMEKVDNTYLVQWALNDIYTDHVDPLRLYDEFVLVSPDAGALKKIYTVAEGIGYEGDIIVASKHRDIKTGKILSTKVPGHDMYIDKDFIIVDDIIDGGRTFIEIAKVIKETFPDAKIYLIVTHGIFSAGFLELGQWFDKIYCTNSVKDIDRSYIEKDTWSIRQRPIFEAPVDLIKQLNIFL